MPVKALRIIVIGSIDLVNQVIIDKEKDRLRLIKNRKNRLRL